MADSQLPPMFDAAAMRDWMEAQMNPADGLAAYRFMIDSLGQMLEPLAKAGENKVNPRDRRFAAPEWQQPVFALMRQGYQIMSDYMLGAIDKIEGLDAADRARMAFAMRTVIDAMSPANAPLTNPVAIERAIATRGESLMKGAAHMIGDLTRGQLTHTDGQAFEVGRNIAATPGKVIHETLLYQLIHYAPTTETVLETPLIVFPPWINRFYILDLSPAKSFVQWCLDQGISLFMVSWKSADAALADIMWDDYIASQIDAIDRVRELLDVPAVHTIGYCVAGTTLAATLAVLAARGEADKVRSATFFTAQVDFSEAGDLLNFIDDTQLAMIEGLGSGGTLDGRYLALTFNMLRGNDLIWSTVAKNYLLGEDYPAFDLLHWNGDVTNLPARWHMSYLRDLYQANLLVQPGALRAMGTPIDLTKIVTPAYIQAGREDHIAPAASVWKIRDHFKGPLRFVLAGSGHIAGVVNPPSAGKYQYWTNDDEGTETLDQFVAGATETKGSWWPDWRAWLGSHGADSVPAKGARIPGKGKLKAIEDAPGRYVRTR